MPPASPPPDHLSLLTDSSGIIQELIRNDFDLARPIGPGVNMAALFDAGSLTKALRFMEELKREQVLCDWHLNILERKQTTPLHFCGAICGKEVILIGARSGNGAMALFEDLMRMNNQHVNTIRRAVKEKIERATHKSLRNDAHFEELTRLNNELANLQRKIAKKNIALEQLNTLKNQFLGMAAHDLHHPIGVIQMYSEFLIEETAGQLSDEHREFLTIIRASSDAMQQMIADFLDIAKIESGRLTLNRRMADLSRILTENAQRNLRLAAKKGIRLLLSPDPPATPVYCDPPKIDQVLNNLISNAIKYSDPDTTVRVEMAAGEAAVTITVKDQGWGIPADQRDDIFQPFRRVRNGRPAEEKSSGLGLAIVHKIITAHGGRIDVESAPGAGSTFRVVLPRMAPDGGKRAGRRPGDPPPKEGEPS